ncbi:dCMP deaminase [Longispora urticae]
MILTEDHPDYLAHLYWMGEAIREADKCPPDEKAYSVGAIIVGSDGKELSRGFSREVGRFHAEESALEKLDAEDPRLATATIYSTLEPCTERKSGRMSGTLGSCTALILRAGIKVVVIAWTEPDYFVADCVGVETLEAAGVTVIQMPELASAAKAANAHLPIS